MLVTIVIILLVIIVPLCALKLYIKFTTGWCKSYMCLSGKTAIVTGANSGIGYYTALDLAKRGCRVILGCRNKERAEKARVSIINATGNPNVVAILIDMESLESVRQFAKQFNESEERLDILVNNAGAIGLGNRVTEDGFQISIQVNYLSPVLLTHLLLDKLKASAPSRIVNVSSKAASFARVSPEDMNKYPTFLPGIFCYANAKLCNILYTLELAKRLEGSNVTVNVLHPGAVYTNAISNVHGLMHNLLKIISVLFYKTSEEGAQTTIFLSVAKEVENITGGLFEDCTQIPLFRPARNPDLAKKIWEKSEEYLHI